MSTIAVAVTVTWTGGFTASTLPATQAGGSTRTMAATDEALTHLAQDIKDRLIANYFSGIDPNARQHTAVTVTVT